MQYRYKLDQIGVGNKIRIIAQYRRKMYERLLLLRVRLLDDYIEIGEDFINRDSHEFWFSDDSLTDHVQLDISGCADKRLTEYRETGDIIICTCEIYQYAYNGIYNEMLGRDINFGLKNPTDIVLLKPLVYNSKLVFLPKNKDAETSYYRYVGSGSRGSIPSEWWDFTQLEILPITTIGFDDITEYKGYESVNETATYLDLLYEKHNSKIRVYKSIKDYCKDCEKLLNPYQCTSKK